MRREFDSPSAEIHAHAPGSCALVREVSSDVETLFKGVLENSHAVAVAKSVEWKLNWLLGVTGTALAFAVAAFVWLFTQQQHAMADAVTAAGREAKTVVVEQWPGRATEVAREAVRLEREERAKEERARIGLTVTSR
jgi:hypothetical protein